MELLTKKQAERRRMDNDTAREYVRLCNMYPTASRNKIIAEMIRLSKGSRSYSGIRQSLIRSQAITVK